MTNLNRRIQLQREALRVTNSVEWKEPLFGLTKLAIRRWLAANDIAADSSAAHHLNRISQKLGFFATKSQDPVENRHSLLLDELEGLIVDLASILDNMRRDVV